MGTDIFVPAKTGFTRVFIADGGARPDHAPDFKACMMAGSPEQDFGDVDRIEVPDPFAPGQFIEAGQIQGAVSRPKITLTGRYAAQLASDLLAMAKRRCDGDLHVHFGECADLSNFDTFEKSLIIEAAKATNWSADDLGALSSDDNKEINEQADFSGKEMYEVLPLSFSEKAGDVVTNEVLDLICADAPSCGSCASESDGATRFYGVTKAAGGSPTTPPDIVYSLDKGATWYATDIDSLSSAQDAVGIARIGNYLVAISTAANNLNYVLQSELDATGDETWVGVTTGFVAAKQPVAIWSTKTRAYIAGKAGYVYLCTDPTAGVTVLDAGTLTVDDLNAVHAYNDKICVVVGNNGAILYTTNGKNFTKIPAFVGAGTHFTTVWCVTDKVWWVGTSTGKLYYTANAGVTWTEKTFSGSGSGKVWDIHFATKNVGYMSHASTTPRGRIFRTYNGGYTWNLLPEGLAVMPLSDRFTALAVSPYDPNLVIAGGLGDNASDGIIAIGQD